MILSKYGRRAALAALLAATTGCAAPAPTLQTAAVPSSGDETLSTQADSSRPAPLDVSQLPTGLTADQLVKVPMDRIVQVVGDSEESADESDRSIQQRGGRGFGGRGFGGRGFGGRGWGGRGWGGRGFGGWGGLAYYSYPYYYPYYYNAGSYYPYTYYPYTSAYTYPYYNYAYPYNYPFYYNTGYYYPYFYGGFRGRGWGGRGWGGRGFGGRGFGGRGGGRR